MNKLLLLLFAFFATSFYSQSELKVQSAGDLNPISNAEVYCNGKLMGTTNSFGILKFKTKCKKVDVQARGYYEDEVVVDKVMEIALEKADPKTASIEKIVLSDKSDPRALAILQKVTENYKHNSPNSLDSYAFKSYEKISFDFDSDTVSQYSDYLEKRLDSLKALPIKQQTEKKKKDSLEELNVMKMMTQSKMFIWERAQQFMFSKKYGEKVTVLDNRMAGLNEPVYELITLRSNRTKMPREVQEENRKLYRYFLSDTIEIDGRKNFVIRFREVSYKKPVNRRKFNGYLYIDQETYGIKKIESNSRKKEEGSITSIWIPIENKWFLQKENMKLRAGSTAFTEEKKKDGEKTKKKKFGFYVYRTADYFDYKTNFEEKAKDFKGYTMEVQSADGSLLDKYRTDSLSAREKLTYTKIDSVGAKYKLDQKAKLFSGMTKGFLRVGNVNIAAADLIQYNKYEGFRPQLTVKMNEKFNRYISPDAYFAYGFRDKAVKYGLGIDVKMTLKKHSFFRAEYYNDVMAGGRFNENLWNFRMKFMNSGIDLHNENFYAFEGFKLSFENDLLNTLTLRVSAARDHEEAKFNYDFNNLGNAFKNFSTLITLKYAPRSKNIMTPAGKYTYEHHFPEFFFNYEKGFKALGGNFSFDKFDFLAVHTFKTKLGSTGIRAYSGILFGDAPIWRNFQMNGLGNGKPEVKLNLTSYLGFATMEAGKYYGDKFAGFYFTHRIPWYFKSFGQSTSSFDWVYRGIIGDMKKPELHSFDFQKLNHLYQETGLEWNNFLSTGFNLGFFYRVGHYRTANFKENFAVQLKLNILGF